MNWLRIVGISPGVVVKAVYQKTKIGYGLTLQVHYLFMDDGHYFIKLI